MKMDVSVMSQLIALLVFALPLSVHPTALEQWELLDINAIAQ